MRHPTLLLPAAVALSGCMYEAPFPLGDASTAPFDQALLGTWEIANVDTVLVLVHRFNEHEYLAEWEEVTTGTGGVETRRDARARFFITVLDEVRFLNVQELGDTVYSFAAYSVSGDELRLRWIPNPTSGEALMPKPAPAPERGKARGLWQQAATGAELRATVYARRHDPLLFDEEETVLRRILEDTTAAGP